MQVKRKMSGGKSAHSFYPAPGIYHLHIKEARAAISNYIHNYNFERCHSAIGNVTLASVYYPAMLYEAARDVA